MIMDAFKGLVLRDHDVKISAASHTLDISPPFAFILFLFGLSYPPDLLFVVFIMSAAKLF